MHFVDLGESFATSICLQNLASIQPRTILVKFARFPRTDRPGFSGNIAEAPENDFEAGRFLRALGGTDDQGGGLWYSRFGGRYPPNNDFFFAEFQRKMIGKICNFLQIFGGLVFDCIKTKS